MMQETATNFLSGYQAPSMSEDIFLRVIALCVMLAGVETLHGIARTTLLAPRIGKRKALKLSIVTGSLLAYGVCLLMVPDLGLGSSAELLGLGLTLALFMAGFDIALARWLLRLPWPRVFRDFDPRTGNYLSLGLVLLAFMPYLAVQS